MNWLKDHAYLATWLALPVTILTGLIQNFRARFTNIDWSRQLLYIAFVTALAVTFTPTFDQSARETAKFLMFSLIWVLIWDMKPRP
jgi:hypothetical protein